MPAGVSDGEKITASSQRSTRRSKTGSEWSRRLTRTIGKEVRFHRKRLQMTQQQLADQTAKLGHLIPRMTLSSIEDEGRDSISVGEWLVLAAALRVPPVALLLPFGHAETVTLLPIDGEVDPVQGLRWLTGDVALTSQPMHEVDSEVRAAITQAKDLQEYLRSYEQHLQRLESEGAAMDQEDALSDEQMAALRKEAGFLREILQSRRAFMRERGEVPPAIGPALAHLDDGGMRAAEESR